MPCGNMASSPTVGIFGVKSVLSFPLPWQLVITTAIGHPVVPNAYNFIFCVHHTCPYLDHRGRKQVNERRGWGGTKGGGRLMNGGGEGVKMGGLT